MPADSVGLSLFQSVQLVPVSFQAAGLISGSSFQLVLSERLGPSVSGHFQGLPEPIFELFILLLKALPCWIEFFSPGENCCTTPVYAHNILLIYSSDLDIVPSRQ